MPGRDRTPGRLLARLRGGASERALAAVLAGALALAAVGCGGTPATPGSGTIPPTGSIPAQSGPVSTLGQPSTPAGSSGTATSLVVDPSLLAVLPASVDGLAVEESSAGEQDALKDPNLPKVASAVASGLAIDAATSEFVFAVVVRLLPGAMNDARFRDWRDSYDDGACSQANGVETHAETTIGGRDVFITTCAGGVVIHHVWLPASSLLISASSVGDGRRLGEKLVAGLRT